MDIAIGTAQGFEDIERIQTAFHRRSVDCLCISGGKFACALAMDLPHEQSNETDDASWCSHAPPEVELSAKRLC